MNIELVGLAYDENQLNGIWSKTTARETFDSILEDDFRRKVDFRSMLYHKGQMELLQGIEGFLRQGGENLTPMELLSFRFAGGVEEFPNSMGELAFDFQLIRHFASLAMADDFLVAERFLNQLLRKVGFSNPGTVWSLLTPKNYEAIVTALREVRMKDILEVAESVQSEDHPLSFENLVRNYIEFLNYAHNNHLTPFFYNSSSDFRHWGDLSERKNQRGEKIVDLSLGILKKKSFKEKKNKPSLEKEKNLHQRMKVRREREALIGGLKDSDPLIRQKAAESLSGLVDVEVLPFLEESLQDPEPEVRQEVVRGIGSLPVPRAEELLLQTLCKDEVFSVRLIAANFLRHRKSKASLPILLKAVAQGQPHFSVLLAYHPELEKDSSTQTFLKTMAQEGDPLVRRDVAFIFGRLPLSKSEDVLLHLSKDEDEETRSNALYSLWDRGSSKLWKVLQSSPGTSSGRLAETHAILHYWKKHKRAEA